VCGGEGRVRGFGNEPHLFGTGMLKDDHGFNDAAVGDALIRLHQHLSLGRALQGGGRTRRQNVLIHRTIGRAADIEIELPLLVDRQHQRFLLARVHRLRAAFGNSTLMPCVSSGAVTMKMINNTSITSM